MGTGSYFDKALTHTNGELVETMRHALRGVEYDTIVGTGLSGTIFTARVAPGLHKKFAIVRKEDDRSTHSCRRVEGQIGNRYVFADDFVSGGTTMRQVLTVMREKHPQAQFVGVYQYESDRFSDAEHADSEFGDWVSEIALGGPLYGPMTRQAFMNKYPYDRVTLLAPQGGWDARVAHLVPLPTLDKLELDYQDAMGLPTFWDPAVGTRITARDPRVKDLVKKVMDGTNGRFDQFIGMRMREVLAMVDMNKKAYKTDEAVTKLRKIAESRLTSA